MFILYGQSGTFGVGGNGAGLYGGGGGGGSSGGVVGNGTRRWRWFIRICNKYK